jgi:Fe-S-cluster containining protein
MGCIACGDCCRHLNLSFTVDKKMRELLQTHYGKKVDIFYFRLRHKCIHLGDDNLCRIYDSPERPEFCHEYLCKGAKGEQPHSLSIHVEDK